MRNNVKALAQRETGRNLRDSASRISKLETAEYVSGAYAGDTYLRSDTLLVDAAFTAGLVPGRYTSIGAALAAASAGTTIRIAPGIYTEDVTLADDFVTIIGSGQPLYDGTDLVGGTIIEGLIDLDDHIGIGISHLGVDIRGTAEINAIISGAITTGLNTNHCFENVSVIGKGSVDSGDRGHGILCQSGDMNTIRGCKIYLFYHGLALRCGYNIVSDCYFFACLSNSIILKSESGSGHSIGSVISNCRCDGDAASGFTRAGPIRIQAANASYLTKYNIISGISFANSAEAMVIIQAVSTAILGNVGWNEIIGVSGTGGGDSATRADFDLDTTTDNNFTNCNSIDRSDGYGVRATTDCARNRFIGCKIDDSGAGKIASGTLLMWQDFGGGGGIEAAVIEGMYQTDGTSSSVRLIDRRQEVTGQGLCTTSAETFLQITHTTGTGTGSIHFRVIVGLQSGNGARTYTFDVAIVRPSSSTLTCTISTPVVTTAGTITATLAFTADTATSNVVNLQVAASTGTVGYAYGTEIVAMNESIWTAENLAA